LARSVGRDAASSTTTTITLTDPIAAGSTGVLGLSADNMGALGAAANIPTSITDSKSNTWTLRQTVINDPGAAGGGIEVGIYTCLLGTALARGDTLTVTYPVAVASDTWVIWEFAGYVFNSAATGSNGQTPARLQLLPQAAFLSPAGLWL
jgi:hypothetical protein